MSVMRELFPDFDQMLSGGEVTVACDKPTLILAITARTGSTNLCSILGRTGKFGEPTEILNPRGVVQHLKKQHSAETFAEYLAALARNPEPYFAFKTSWLDFEPIAGTYTKLFPQTKFVFLDRFDIAAQTISLYRALVSGEWHRTQIANGASAPAEPDLELDVEKAISMMAKLMHEKIRWERFFFSEQIDAQHFYYELVEKDWGKAAAAVLKRCGFDIGPAQVESTGKYSKMGDELSERWIRQLKEAAGLKWLTLE